MDKIIIGTQPDIRYQVRTMVVTPDNTPIRANVEIRYLNEPGLWYLSIFDAATGESKCRYVPIIASYNERNDLMAPFRHKNIGSIYCVPTVANPSSQDPGLDNLGEFALVWGDSDDL